MVFYHDGYLRVSIKEHDPQATDREVHLTNSHVQVTSKWFKLENHFWMHKKIQDYFDILAIQIMGDLWNKVFGDLFKKNGIFVLNKFCTKECTVLKRHQLLSLFYNYFDHA